MAQDIEASHGLHVSVDVLGDPHRLPPDLELVAFRIAQEGLSNVVQHAQATATALAIEFQADDLILRLEDDGVGFIAPEQPHNWRLPAISDLWACENGCCSMGDA